MDRHVSNHAPPAPRRRGRSLGAALAAAFGLVFALAACGAGGGSAPPGDDGLDGMTTPAPLDSGDALATQDTTTE
jgi:hypothetical protein